MISGLGRSPRESERKKVKSLSHVWLFATPWTVAYQAPLSMGFPRDFPGNSTGVACHFLLQGILPTQGSKPGLPHCRQMLYHLSHQGRYPGEGKGKWLQYSGLENSMDCIVPGIAKSRIRLSDFPFNFEYLGVSNMGKNIEIYIHVSFKNF